VVHDGADVVVPAPSGDKLHEPWVGIERRNVLERMVGGGLWLEVEQRSKLVAQT
jgi:hypothetical protein